MKPLFIFSVLAVMLSACPTSPGNAGGGGGGTVQQFSRIGFFSGTGVDGLNLFDNAPSGRGISYRIPGILTLANGNVIAAADDRKGVTSDSAHNIDIAVRISSDQGKTWGAVKYPLHFDDFSENNQPLNTSGNTSAFSMSASYIDAAVGQAANGDIFIIANAFPWKSGVFGNGEQQPKIPNWDNYIRHTDGKTYLRLRYTNNTGDRTRDTTYEYMVDPTGGPILKRDGSTPASGDAAFGYSIDRNWYVLLNGVKTKSDQYVSGASINALAKETPPKQIENKLLYYNSPFQTGTKNFLFMSRSTDGGNTWTEGAPICHMIWDGPVFKSEPTKNNQGFIMSPGKFITIQEGVNTGRMIAAVQAVAVHGGNEYAASIYSDDNGVTWKPGGNAVNLPAVGGKRFSETQLVEAPDNQIIAMGRSGDDANRIPFAISTDGGHMWGLPEYTTLVQCRDGGSMVGATSLRLWTSFGRPMIAVTHATGQAGTWDAGRFGGMISLGYLEKDNKGLWKPVFPGYGGPKGGTISENDPAFWTWFYPGVGGGLSAKYAYSCITELSNGNLAILAEGKGYTGGTETPGYLTYKELVLEAQQ